MGGRGRKVWDEWIERVAREELGNILIIKYVGVDLFFF